MSCGTVLSNGALEGIGTRLVNSQCTGIIGIIGFSVVGGLSKSCTGLHFHRHKEILERKWRTNNQ